MPPTSHLPTPSLRSPSPSPPAQQRWCIDPMLISPPIPPRIPSHIPPPIPSDPARPATIVRCSPMHFQFNSRPPPRLNLILHLPFRSAQCSFFIGAPRRRLYKCDEGRAGLWTRRAPARPRAGAGGLWCHPAGYPENCVCVCVCVLVVGGFLKAGWGLGILVVGLVGVEGLSVGKGCRSQRGGRRML
jgi:hypothetical protein